MKPTQSRAKPLAKSRASLTAALTGLKAQCAAPAKSAAQEAPVDPLASLIHHYDDGEPSRSFDYMEPDEVRAYIAASHASLVGALKGLMEHAAMRPKTYDSEGKGQAAFALAVTNAELAIQAAQPHAAPIQIGDSFIMPEPNATENWLHGNWTGRVVGFKDHGHLVTVKDADDDAFDITAGRLAACERA